MRLNLRRSATEAQLGLADEFEFEFDLKFDDRVRVRVSSSGLWVTVSVSSLEYPFGDPFSVPFRVHLGTHFRSLLGSREGPENDHSQQQVNSVHSVGVSSLKCRVRSTGSIAQSPSHSLSHPSDGFATTPARSQRELP